MPRPLSTPTRPVALLLGAALLAFGALASPARAYADEPVTHSDERGAAYTGDRPRVLVGLGDSVPAGTNCVDPNFITLLGQRGGYQVVNRAMGGATVADVYAELADPSLRADLAAATEVVLMIGANDLDAAMQPETAGEDPAEEVTEVRRQFARLLTEIHQQSNAHIVLVGYWNVSTAGAVAETLPPEVRAADEAATRQLNQMLAELAAEHDASFVDPSEAYGADPTELLTDDGDHPNGAGHVALADATEPALRR
ncbi:hypothetical protein CGZ93_05945 [Enemella dayhoffiae]|uniref:SGNH hydrolase-type esterase domain-containing protein n=1 Tax=Enemella dayhoffiae TaxID=2016507 RepID=A0A255H7A4_9ACTN|nr:SGNH/GDSL hydrolase family protein [Enemella dayhoffiae]OYO23481.1 hypothetical protein CGZ93_05945 [Enemella dayhoffiae]